MKSILVAVDLEKGDQILLDHASKLALKCDAKVWIIHVAAPDPEFVGYDTGPAYIRKTLADDLREEHKAIRTYTQSIQAMGVKVEGLLIQGPTVQTIFDEADKLEADILVLGAHKHNFLKRVFGDDISHQVIDKSKIPLLIIPLG